MLCGAGDYRELRNSSGRHQTPVPGATPGTGSAAAALEGTDREYPFQKFPGRKNRSWSCPAGKGTGEAQQRSPRSVLPPPSAESLLWHGPEFHGLERLSPGEGKFLPSAGHPGVCLLRTPQVSPRVTSPAVLAPLRRSWMEKRRGHRGLREVFGK